MSNNFWHDGSQQDPKRQYRWVLYNNNIPLYTLMKVAKPSFEVSAAEHKFLNHTYYYPGRVTWQSISMTLADPVNPDAAATVADIITRSGYAPANNQNELGTMSKAAATAALGQIEIVQLDSAGQKLEVWTLHNPFIINVDYGELDYDGDELTQITLEVRYDYAHLQTLGGGAAVSGDTDFWNPGRSS